ncbi:TetR/AcrR family transcriptional regulator [Umezawaea sp. Da 62-37]|uniref:TetR/AcrR family transcriptional regulator n=1 Tax=Umezawaea sp. Da 62-37 TaxID=3075927 RepID=UPI0028F6D90B|nr:TetR/AcrR family transcriptional regulator [Umezawaea sp. Da 62-37]WNV83379.1 TetR/AcrR family transcriptional regulator [Umezawaea sp. Da 62-37]
MSLETGKRRRGSQLEAAILDAAWEQLVEGGYGAFTVEAVAERARTSRHVLYRRWPTRGDLALAAIRRGAVDHGALTADTGSLRGDVIALMTRANEDRPRIAAMLSVHLGTYYRETGTTPADLRQSVVGDSGEYLEEIFRRAVERGEIPSADLPARVKTLPGDLLRNEVLMTLAPVSEETIAGIVDEVFLPLVLKG